MPFLATDQSGEQARTQWLIRLRWVACAGVLAVITGTGPVLGFVQETGALYALVLFLGLFNLVLQWRSHHSAPIPPASRQVVLDLLVLGGLLFFSGGLRNPFAGFLAVQAILGAVLLPRPKAIRLGLLGVALVLVLALLEIAQVLPITLGALQTRPLEPEATLALWGTAASLIITLAVALFFTVNIMDDLRERAHELQRTHVQVERERLNLRNVVRSMGAGLVILDPDLRVTWSNRIATDMLQDSEGAKRLVLDGPWLSREALARGETRFREWQARDGQGRKRWLEVSAAPVRSAEGRMEQVILLLVDVTERRAALGQLQLTEKLSALGRLAAGIAHEISTPLASVGILASEARAALPPAEDPEGRAQVIDFLTDIGKQVDRISRLVRRLLDLSHEEADSDEPVDLEELVREAVRLLSVGEERSRILIDEPVNGALPPLEIGRDRLLQVLLNVLDNALDATRRTNGTVQVRAGQEEEAHFILVTDQGYGISDENLPRIFDPFFTTKDVGEGTGLGLYVSYEIMRTLGGDIEVTSRDGEGTAVLLSLPSRLKSHTGAASP